MFELGQTPFFIQGEEMKYFGITLVQSSLRWEDPPANRERIRRMLERLEEQTDLILLPEMFTTGFTMEPEEFFEEPEGETLTFLREMASRHDAAVAGSYIVREESHYFNRLLFVKPSGEAVYYDKRHLFRMGGEHLHYSAGNSRVIVRHRGVRVGLFICYDLRFPVWIRSRNEADLLIFAANWPAPRREVWNTLLKARALENQAYVAGVNRVGEDGRQITYAGDSQVVSPRGEVLEALPGNVEGVIHSRLDMEGLAAFRKKFPVHLDADDFRII